MIDLPLVSLDLELLDKGNSSEIIEVGAVKFRGDQTLDTFSSLVRPAGKLSHRIGELTGLTADELATADSLEQILPRLSSFIGGCPLVGQSICLDVEHLRRAGLSVGNPQLDTFELAMLLRPGLSAYDLQSIASDLALPSTRRHRALPDALLARDVFLALARLAAKLDADVLAKITRLAAPLDWPLKLVFAEAHRARLDRQSSSGSAGDELGGLPGPLAAIGRPVQRDPLIPNERFSALDVESLSASLRAGGPIAQAIVGFEERPEQLQMLAAVAEAFNNTETLLVEAGTGTGKSLAYLLPAAHLAVANNRRVVISTNTINLQDQLCEKDLPDLIRATGLPARVAVVKGRNNYLCLRRWLTLLGADAPTPTERMVLIKTLLWLPRTTTGDRAELKLGPGEEEVWGKLAAVAEACSPLRCTFHRQGLCFVARARRAAENAHLVIVNHSLLLSDLMTGNQVLPEYVYLVIDEAHHLEDEATTQLSYRVTEREALRRLNELAEISGGRLVGLIAEGAGALRRMAVDDLARRTAAELATRGGGEVRVVREGLSDLFKLLGEFLHARAERGDAGQLTVRITRGARAQPDWSEIDVLWAEVGKRVLALQRTLADLLQRLEESARQDERVDAIGGELAAQATFWDGLRIQLQRVIAEADASLIAWLSLGQTGELGVNVAPLNVGDVLRDQLIDPKQAVVMTSATLTTEGSFRYIRERLGVLDGLELTVGSPFDYATSTLVYIPSDGPEPGHPGYQKSVERTILDVTSELGGRTLVLFTSHNQLRTTYQALREALDARKVILLGQRMDGTSRARLLETFKSGPASVLMGTNSFWEGIDVVGEALSCLIMARLPFALPTDPIFEARSEQFEDPFTQYALPQAVLRFRQGFGRLIRSQSDRGVMVVLDGRLRSRSYRWAFLRSLPACEVRVGPAAEAGCAAREWIDGVASQESRVATVP
ncbi:MAG TPA: helicase C-terminal domain-containing protein [Chloroflexota bacterium]|nr:helicase C-terminal domain-containing protein [Chloroflexota bacterium]